MVFKLKYLKMDISKFSKLSRNEMKMIKGGVSSGDCYMCCWDGGGSCSRCVTCTSSCTCDEGSHIHVCPSSSCSDIGEA